jgi:hypothetical protein
MPEYALPVSASTPRSFEVTFNSSGSPDQHL